MTTFIWLKCLGIVFIIKGVAISSNKKLVKSVLDGVKTNRAVAFVFAFFPLWLGAYLVASHNFFDTLPEKLVSVVGWLFLLGGSFRVMFMDHWIKMATEVKGSLSHLIIGAVMFVLGVVFLYFGGSF